MYQNGNKTSKIMEAKACCVQSYSTKKQYKNFTQAYYHAVDIKIIIK